MAAGFATLIAAGCDRDVGVERVADAGFVYPETDADAGDAGPAPDATTAGCAVLDLSGCAEGRECCAVPAERCVPSVSGANRCVASGPLGAGSECGTGGEDDCGFGLLCSGVASGATASTCRAICEPGTTPCVTGSCRLVLEAGGESIGVCD